MNEEVIRQFHGLAYWSLSVACYVCSSGKPFLTAPIGVNDFFLGVPGTFFHLLFCLLSENSSRATWPSNGSHLSCPLVDDLLEDRAAFLCLLIPSSASSGVLETSQGFHKCLLHWIHWVCIAGPLFRDWYLMGFPQSEAVDHVPGGSVALFPTLLPCVCPWGFLGNIVLQEASILEAVCTASKAALTWPCRGTSGRIYNTDSVICLAAFLHWFSWTLLQLTLFLPNVTH